MIRYYLIDVILFLGACSAFLLLPLRNEFIYQRVSEEHSYNKTRGSYCGPNGTNQTTEDQIVADEVSRVTMLTDLALFLPAMVVGALLTSWGDWIGRKITMVVPLLGMVTSGIILGFIIHFHWPLSAMFGYSAVAGFSGYYMTLLMQGTAYLSDVTDIKRRAIRFTVLETFIGVGGGMAGLGGGFWIKAEGFLPAVWCTSVLSGVALLLIPFLPDSLEGLRKTSQKNREENCNEEKKLIDCEGSSNNNASDDEEFQTKYGTFEPEEKEAKACRLDQEDLDRSEENCDERKRQRKHYKFSDLWKSVWRVYTTEYMTCDKCFGPDPDLKLLPYDRRCEHGGGILRGRVWRIWLYLLSYCTYMFVNVGMIVFQTMFYLSYPLCFSPVLVGAQLTTKYISVAAGPLFVYIFQRFAHMGNQAMIMIGLIGFFACPFTMSFATKPYLVFVATSTMTVGCLAKPLIQAQISSLASESEQGAAFALLSSSEVFSFLLATLCYLSIYPATLHISHWFTWMFSAAVILIPITFISIIWIADRRRVTSKSGMREPLLNDENRNEQE